ncbi:MAG TPA: glycosyltransferase [Puia sp.]|nr:glycosyltransferase [Puia sp.]
MKTVYFTVTNDLSFDQRMRRICGSLSAAGYHVVLVGRLLPYSKPLVDKQFKQIRLRCRFKKGWVFYAEFNIMLFFYLLKKKADAVCAIDLDTILPVLLVSKIKHIPRVYDAHELFCEMKEVVTRPSIYRLWKKIEKFAVPKFKYGYTVSTPIAQEFKKMYNVSYQVIRNLPRLNSFERSPSAQKFILYQGAVNEGRSFETLIPAMKNVEAKLFICGDGNFMQQAKKLVKENGLEEKIVFKGMILPDELVSYTQAAYIGITLFENNGASNYFSLANRFFDYINAGLPQVCVNYPAYKEINDEHRIALLIDDLKPETISKTLNNLLADGVLHDELKNNCMKARAVLNWQQEEKKLISFYNQLFS